jgi:hypothetical protein
MGDTSAETGEERAGVRKSERMKSNVISLRVPIAAALALSVSPGARP